MTTAEGISTIIVAALAVLGTSGRWVRKVVEAVMKVVTEIKVNTTAVKELGDKMDGNFSSVQSTLNDHETRITVLEKENTL